MSKIERYQGNLRAFASNAQGLERTVFGGTEQANDLTSQVTAAFLRGWGIVGPSEHPSLEDFNAAMFAMSQFLAYQHQIGTPEWHAEQEYYTGSVCTHGGVSYQSLIDDNVGNEPPSAQWTPVLTAKSGGEAFQPKNEKLTAFSGLAGAANRLPYFTGANALALTALTALGRDLIGKATVAEVLTYLGLGSLPASFGSAAGKNVGTGTDELPTTLQADARYGMKKWSSSGVVLSANVPVIVSHGLNIDPDLSRLNIKLRCRDANNGYAVGEYCVGFAPRIASGDTGAMAGSIGALLTSTTCQFNPGSAGIAIMPKGSGAAVGINSAATLNQWALEFHILYQ